MRTVAPAELKAILAAHRKWRRGESGGSRADLADANLAGANLVGANLADAYLVGANLADAYLARAYLARAYLADANLAGADLADAYLAGADLADANLVGANLVGANLADAKNKPASLADHKDPETPYVRGATGNRMAYAERYRQRHPEVPVVERLDSRILDAISSGRGKLDMSRWHTCDTTHCRAGWAIALAGEAGAALEREYGPQRAGAMIYRASTGRAPHFFATDERALEDIRACAAAEGDAP